MITTYNETQIRNMSTARLKIMVQPFFRSYMTATQVLVSWELFHREHHYPRLHIDLRIVAVDPAGGSDVSVCECPTCHTFQELVSPNYRCKKCVQVLLEEVMMS